MPKQKMKLNLDELKIQSFVTTLKKQELDKFRGGTGVDATCPSCNGNTDPVECTVDGGTLNQN